MCPVYGRGPHVRPIAVSTGIGRLESQNLGPQGLLAGSLEAA